MPTPRDARPPDDEGISFVKRLHERFGKEVDPEIQLQSPDEEHELEKQRPPGEEEADSSPSSTSRGLYAKLSDQVMVGRRYQIRREIARGGMGAIIRVWDEDLRRNLAMKVMHGTGLVADPEEVDPERLGRFLEEAQITGQLDHPGVVPVHDLGIDSTGRCYFTMRLVRGRELKEVLDLTREGKEGWTTTKALGLILKVCEAMAYAHSKGVVHRDLKPSNVMVGRFGEVYVMDWGLARVLGRRDSHDLRLRPAAQDVSGVSLVRTVRRDESEANPDSPLVTMDGDVVGTPSFMAIEQAQGKLEEVGPRSDVYSLGSILYYMLSGRAPYVEPGERVSPHTVLNRVLSEPPVPVSKYAKDAPAELVAICEKAMSRNAADRYGSMLEVADDIQAFLENRVVRAYEGGAAAEFKKWVARNRGMAAATAALALFTIASAFGFAWQKGKQVDALNSKNVEIAAERERAEESAAQAVRSEGEAQRNLELALQRKAEADENARIARLNEDLSRRSSYKANIVAADFSLRLNDVKEARKRLDACDPDLRGWEWSHLDLKGDPSLVTVGPYGPIDGVAFTPDGSRFVSLSRSARLRLHDASDGHVFEESQTITMSMLSSLSSGQRSLSLSRDGRQVAASVGGTIRVYELETGEKLHELRGSDEVRGHEGDVTSIAFSPGGRLMASGGEDGAVLVWNISLGTIEQRLPTHQGPVHALAWDAFGERLASASADQTIRIWQFDDERELFVLRGHQGPVYDVAWSLDGERLASCSQDRLVLVWDTATGLLERSLVGHEGAVRGVDFHPLGEQLVTCSADRTVRLWDLETRTHQILRGHEEEVLDVAYDSEGNFVVSGSADRLVKKWDARNEPSSSLVLGPSAPVDAVFDPVYPQTAGLRHESVAIHPEGHVFALGEADDTIAVFDSETGLVEALLRGHEGAVTSLAYSPDGRLLLSGSFDKTARLWDVATGSLLQTLEGHEKWVSAVAFAPDSTWCVTGSGDRRLRIWDTRTGELLETLPGHEGRKGWVMGVAVHPDGERLASSAGDKRIRIWTRGSKEPLATLIGHTQSVSSIAFHPRGDRILSGSLDATARMWDVETGESLFVARGHDVGIYTVAFHPDGTRFSTGSGRGVVRIWDSLSGDPLLEIEREQERINQVAFTPRGTRLLTVAERAVRFWETGGVTERSARRTVARAAQDELVEVVNELFDQHFHLSDVLLRIGSHPDLSDEQREHAARLARLRGDDVWRLDATTRGVVYQPGFAEEDYEIALRRARAACELDPTNAHLQCTLGVAQWRNGLFLEAISTLQLAAETDRLGRSQRSDPDLAPSHEVCRRIVLTLALEAAGRSEDALVELEGVQRFLDSNRTLREEPTVASLFAEAGALVEVGAPPDEES